MYLFPSTPVEQSRRTSGRCFALAFEIRVAEPSARHPGLSAPYRLYPLQGSKGRVASQLVFRRRIILGRARPVHCHCMSDAVLAARAANHADLPMRFASCARAVLAFVVQPVLTMPSSAAMSAAASAAARS